MADRVDFFSLPQGANPDKDPVVGRDELGNPRYRSFLGTEYTLETQPVERDFESEPGTIARVKEVGGDIVEGAIEGVKSAVTAPRRAMEGEAVTQGDVFGTAGLATTGAAGVTKPAGSLSAGAARTKKKSEINPLFKRKTEDDGSLVTFYSPLRSAIEEMQFSEKGKSGQEIMAYLNKRAPNVSKGELDFSRLDLDPKKKYSKDEVLDNLKFSTEGTIARYIPLKQSDYSRVQIQNLSDQKVDYFELSLESKDVPEPLGTHHTENTLAHSRSTVHRDADGEEYVVINELQSDALQNIGKTDVEMEAIPEPLEVAKSTSLYLRDFADVDIDEDILNFGVTSFQNNIPFPELKKQYKEIFGLDVKGNNPVAVSLDALSQTSRPGRDFDVYEFEEAIESMYYELGENEVARSTQKNASTPSSIIPFKTNTEYVKNLLLANIGVAKERGINKVVIPPLEEIARLRAKDFEGGLEGAKKTLRPTYVNAVKKAINILNNEYAGKIKVGSRKLKYPDLTEKTMERVVSGQELDISNFDFDPRSELVRFAEGGQVRSKEDNPILQHHQKNVDEGTYVKNDDGSISTVYTTIMGDGEYEYLIPQVWDGKILSEEEAWDRAMSSGIDWPKEPAGEEGVRKLEQLDEQLHENMSGYAEGGQVKSMEEQMNLFEYGGLADDGMEKEPVTGNEIPPGSMAKEVRDDVPAMLSEGEYVVPADVVRYYGIKFFEDLRGEAKSDMMEMESEGRIGGQPVDGNGVPVEEESLTPEEMAMLQEAMAADEPVGMAQGGVVKGYATGGDITQPQFRYTPGQPYPMGGVYGSMAATGSVGFEARQFINEQTGQIRTFQFLNGQPISFIPPNFKPYVRSTGTAGGTSGGSATAGQGTMTTLGDPTRTIREFDGGPDPEPSTFDIMDLSDEELQAMVDAPNSFEAKAINTAMGILGTPIMGIISRIGFKANASRAEKEQARRAIQRDVNNLIDQMRQDELTTSTQVTTPTATKSDTNIDDESLPSTFNYADEDTLMSQPVSTTTTPQFFAAPPVPEVTVTTLGPAPRGLPSMPPGSLMSESATPTGLPTGTPQNPAFAYTSGNTAPTGTPPAEPTTPSFTAPSFPSIQAQQQALDTALDEAIFGTTPSGFASDSLSMGENFRGDSRTPDYAGTPGFGLQGGPTMSGVPGPTSEIGLSVGGKSATFGLAGTGGESISDIGLNYSGIMGGRDFSRSDMGYNTGQTDLGISPGGTTSGGTTSGPVGFADISASGSGMDTGGGRSAQGSSVSVGYGVGQVDPGLAAAAQSAAQSAPSTPSVGYGIGQVDPGLAAAAAAASRGGGGDGGGMSPAEAASTPSAQAAARGGIEAGIAARGGGSTSADGGGGGGGSKVICTALHNKGLLDSNIYELDEAYGKIVRATNPDLMNGYHKLAVPFANYIQKDTPGAVAARYAVAPFARAWAQEMAHVMKPDEYKGSVVGKVIMAITYPVCEWVGKKQRETSYGRV